MKNKIFMLVLICLFVPSTKADEKFLDTKAKKFSYTPNIIEVDRGDTLKVRLISEDVHYGFFLDKCELNTSTRPAQERLKFVASQTGEFSFRCSVTCGESHPYMVGSLIVKPNSRFLAYVVLIVALVLYHFVFIILSKKIVRDDIFYFFPLPTDC